MLIVDLKKQLSDSQNQEYALNRYYRDRQDLLKKDQETIVQQLFVEIGFKVGMTIRYHDKFYGCGTSDFTIQTCGYGGSRLMIVIAQVKSKGPGRRKKVIRVYEEEFKNIIILK
jgi:hypothetical protein